MYCNATQRNAMYCAVLCCAGLCCTVLYSMYVCMHACMLTTYTHYMIPYMAICALGPCYRIFNGIDKRLYYGKMAIGNLAFNL